MEEFLGSIDCRISHDGTFHWNHVNGTYGSNIRNHFDSSYCVQRGNIHRSSSIQRASFKVVQNYRLVIKMYY